MDQIVSNGSSAGAQTRNHGPIFTPPADIIERGDTIVMLLDVPGAGPESLDVTLDKRVLTISARVTSSVPEGYAPAYIEFRNGAYERRFVFSEEMDGENIDAMLMDGVLRLTMRKAADAGAKKITVKTA
jgi:HSP20 family protein